MTVTISLDARFYEHDTGEYLPLKNWKFLENRCSGGVDVVVYPVVIA